MLSDSIVFCDFDGTITAVETFAGMLKEFSPELSAEIMPQLYNRTLTLREGVRQMLESIPSSYYPQILNYAMGKPVRPGLAELIDFLTGKNAAFVVVSGGLKGMVETVLQRENLIDKVADIFAVEVTTQGEYLTVNSPFEGDTELLAKVKVMEQYQVSEKIIIGDSVTDVNMAMKADLVFARDRLVSYMEDADKSYIPWNNFFDVTNYLIKHWQLSSK
ncbi:MAG TPA: 2-hydroxy-3-keto-5-methylthiopentenyl-1-phosphate phosphatase [Cyanothece sp. UBA12306]|nr:2-hydroxy-3-keto-5-methylthiopentenyl-1-phosphate phosphatase [Cyanothece sp. UBA12306]